MARGRPGRGLRVIEVGLLPEVLDEIADRVGDRGRGEFVREAVDAFLAGYGKADAVPVSAVTVVPALRVVSASSPVRNADQMRRPAKRDWRPDFPAVMGVIGKSATERELVRLLGWMEGRVKAVLAAMLEAGVIWVSGGAYAPVGDADQGVENPT